MVQEILQVNSSFPEISIWLIACDTFYNVLLVGVWRASFVNPKKWNKFYVIFFMINCLRGFGYWRNCCLHVFLIFHNISKNKPGVLRLAKISSGIHLPTLMGMYELQGNNCYLSFSVEGFCKIFFLKSMLVWLVSCLLIFSVGHIFDWDFPIILFVCWRFPGEEYTWFIFLAAAAAFDPVLNWKKELRKHPFY